MLPYGHKKDVISLIACDDANKYHTSIKLIYKTRAHGIISKDSDNIFSSTFCGLATSQKAFNAIAHCDVRESQTGVFGRFKFVMDFKIINYGSYNYKLTTTRVFFN
jgi:hypothetical protein